jgi:general stress protein YciG
MKRRRGFDDPAVAARAGALGGARTPHHKRAYRDTDKAKESGRRGGMAGRGAKKAAAGRLGGLATAAKHRNRKWRMQALRCVWSREAVT